MGIKKAERGRERWSIHNMDDMDKPNPSNSAQTAPAPPHHDCELNNPFQPLGIISVIYILHG